MRRRFRAVALAFVVVSSVWATAPALAADELVVSAARPADSKSSSVPVSGEVKVPDLFVLGADIDKVTITLVAEDGEAVVATAAACGPCGRAEPGKPFKFSTNVPVAANGRYRVIASASGRSVGGLVAVTGTSPPSGGFGVAAPPRPPQDVKTEVSPERAVTVSWARNVEPDILNYQVLRKDPGSEAFRPVGGPVEQPTSPRASFSDPGPAQVGGDFTYRVIAFRGGATPGSRVQSEPTTAEKVTVGAPPGAPTAPGGPPAPGTGTGSAGFLLGGLPAARPDTTAAGGSQSIIPDTGFSDVLPFGARPPGEEPAEEAAEPRSLDVGTTRTEFVARGRPLVPVAGGAVLLLLAIHLRLMNKRMAASSPPLVAGRAESELGTADRPYSPYGGVSLRTQPVAEVEPPLYEAYDPQPDPEPQPERIYDWAQLDDDLVEAVDEEWAGRDWDDHRGRDDDEVLEAMVSPAR